MMDIGDASIGGSIGAVVTALGIWIRARAGSKDAETGMVPQLLSRIDAQDARLDALRDELAKTNARCEEERKEASTEHERQRREDREACDHEIQQLRKRADAELERVQGIALDALSLVRRLPSVTDSMSEEIDRIRARSTTPPRGEWRLEAGGSDTDPGPLFDDED